jgi:ABC-type multidrug transport system ATPase subunit
MHVQVMQTLKDLAGEGRTVVASIHQPRSSIFAMFDDLVLLSEGSLLYAGPAAGCLAHFEAQVCVLPLPLLGHALRAFTTNGEVL